MEPELISSGTMSFTIRGEFVTDLCKRFVAEGSRERALKLLDECFDCISREEAELICDGKIKIVSAPEGMMAIEAVSPEYEGLVHQMNLGRLKPLDALDVE